MGYGIELTPALAAVEEENLEKERAVSDQRIELIQALGICIDGEALQALTRGGQHSDNPLVNFYWDFCGQGKPAYLPVQYMSLAEGVGLVKAAGGLPVLAHPGMNIGRDLDILTDICAEGLEGIEVYSSYHDAETTGLYRDQAGKHGLLKTLGSDFHSKIKPAVRLAGLFCPEEAKILSGIRRALGLS